MPDVPFDIAIGATTTSAITADFLAALVVSSHMTTSASVAGSFLLQATLASGIVGHASEAAGVLAAYKLTSHFIGVAIVTATTIDVTHRVVPHGAPAPVVPQVRVVQQQPPPVHPQILTGARRVQATPRTSPVRVKR